MCSMASETYLDEHSYDDTKMMRILAIDGGGVRGIIPATILAYLEKILQEKDGVDARIADYFDVIAGTSTGGLITAMLTTRNVDKRPIKSAQEIVDFFNEYNCSQIFTRTWMSYEGKGPKYLVAGLKDIAVKQLGEMKISETLPTSVVIPTYDIRTSQPVIFSTKHPEEKQDRLKDAKLSDICIATSAAPTYFPPYNFKINHGEEIADYNLVDGGITANNPTKCAMNYAIEVLLREKEFADIKPGDYSRFLVLSLGTGRPKENKENGLTAKQAENWGTWSWAEKLIYILMDASAQMVDWNVEVDFKTLGGKENQYLRIQENELDRGNVELDNIEEKNIQELQKIGKKLLEKPVSRNIGKFDEDGPGNLIFTNKEALNSLARVLSKQRRGRIAQSLI